MMIENKFVLIKVYLCLKFNRRDKLWIAMEYCGGGSMQDIYHSKYKLKENISLFNISITVSKS